MPAYLVTITMPDDSEAEHTGIYSDSIEAVTTAQECFPEATRVTAKALVLRCARTRQAVEDFNSYRDVFSRPSIRPTQGERA